MVTINWQESSLPQWWSITTEALTPHHPRQCSLPELHYPKYSSSQLAVNHGSSPTSVPCHNQRLMHAAYFSHMHDSVYGAKNWNKILLASDNKLQATYKMQYAIELPWFMTKTDRWSKVDKSETGIYRSIWSQQPRAMGNEWKETMARDEMRGFFNPNSPKSS